MSFADCDCFSRCAVITERKPGQSDGDIQDVVAQDYPQRQQDSPPRPMRLSRQLDNLWFAKNESAGIALRCNAFITVMQAAEVRNLDDPSDTRDLPCMWTLLVES